MKSGQHLKLPKSELEQMKADLQRQARMEKLRIDIIVKDNGDGTVNISWTISDANVPVTSAGRAEEKQTVSEGTSRAETKSNPTSTAPTSGSEPAPSVGGRSIDRGLSEKSKTADRGAASVSAGAESATSTGKIPNQAIEIVTSFEGFVDHVYDDGVGVATIGYGTTCYPNGRRVCFGDPKITKETAKVYLAHDLEIRVKQLNSSIPHWNEMDDNRRSALISFAYNLGENFFGCDAFKTITAKLRAKHWDDVPKAMELYCNPNDPKVHAGLLRRRKAEGELWQGKGPFAK